MAARIAIIAITTSSSMSVNAIRAAPNGREKPRAAPDFLFTYNLRMQTQAPAVEAVVGSKKMSEGNALAASPNARRRQRVNACGAGIRACWIGGLRDRWIAGLR